MICSGYDDVFRTGFLPSGGRARNGLRQSGNVAESSDNTENRRLARICRRLKAFPLANTPSIPPEQLAFNFFFHYIQTQRAVKAEPAFLIGCIMESSTSALGRALEAAALSFFTLNRRYAVYKPLAYRKYAHAVTSVREEFQRPPLQFSEKLVMALWFLCLFEVCYRLPNTAPNTLTKYSAF